MNERYRSLYVSEVRRVVGDAETIISAGGTGDLRGLLRSFHTIKGMSATMDCAPILMLAHTLEDVCEGLVAERLPTDDEVLRLLFAGLDGIRFQIDAVERSEEPEENAWLERAIRDHLQAGSTTAFRLVEPGVEEAVEEPADDAPQVEDAIGALAEIFGACAMLRESENGTRSPSADVWSGDQIARIEAAARRMYGRLVEMRQVRLGTVFPQLRRHLRVVCSGHGKDAVLHTTGDDILIDPDVLLPLQGVFTHLLANAVIHGLEPREERVALLKPPAGQILLRVEAIGDTLAIWFSDDGRGLDGDRLREVARSPDGDPVELALRPGVTTAAALDQHAGRGFGLHSAAHAVRHIGGTLSLQTAPGTGLRVRIEVPLMRDLAEILLVRVADQTFALLTRDACAAPGSFPEAPPLLGLAVAGDAGLVLTGTRTPPATVRVDRVLGVVEAIVRPPPFPLGGLREVLGTTVGPDGTILFVLDPEGS